MNARRILRRPLQLVQAWINPPTSRAAPLDQSPEDGRSSERNRRAALTMAVGFASRTVGIVASLVSVPILLRYLGVEFYGVWLTIMAGSAWLALVQFGIAPSLVNRLSALDSGAPADRASLVSTAWWLEIVIAGAALIPLAVLYNLAPWHSLFNLPPGQMADDARAVTAIVWLGLAVSLPASLPAAVLRAAQEGYTVSILEMMGALARLAAIVVVVVVDAGVVALAIAYTLAGLSSSAAAAVYVFARRFRDALPSIRHVSLRVAGSLLSTGSGFTMIAVAAIVISYTDVIVITQVLGPASVPAYAIAYTLLQVFVGLEMLVLDAAWPGYVEAAARGDHRWIRTTHRRLTRLFLVGPCVFAIGLIVLGQPLIRVWAGADVVPPFSLLATLAVLAVVQAYQLPHGRLLTSLGHVRFNAGLGMLSAAINLPLSIILARQLGITGVALGTLIGYLVIGGFLVARARRTLAELAPETCAEGC